MHRFPGDRPGVDEDPGPEVGPRAAAQARARVLVLRMAFVGAATCGMLLTAGAAAAHADTPSAGSLVATTTQTVSSPITSATETVTDAVAPVVDTASSAVDTTAGVVETTADSATKTLDTATKTVDTVTKTVDTVTKTVDTVTTKSVDTVAKTVDPVTKTVDTVAAKAVDTVTKTVGTVTDDLSSRVADTAGVLQATARDAADTVTTGLGGAADEVSIGRAADVTEMPVGPDHRARVDRTALAAVAARRSAVLDARESSVGTSWTAPTAARDPAPESPGPAPPSLPFGGSAPALPFAPSAAGLALTLVGVLLLRTTASPPLGWRRHALATIPFYGAAVALAVERPG